MNIEERLRRMGEQERKSELPSQVEWDRFRTRGHGRLLRRRAYLVVAAAVIVIAGAQGAGSMLRQEAAPLPPAGDDIPRVTEDTVKGQIAMQAWYVQGEVLYLDHQFVEASMVSESERAPSDRAALMEATVERVLGGPSEHALESTDPVVRTIFRPETRLLDLDLGRETSVDLSRFPEGLSDDERNLALAQIAATVLQYDDVVSVEILEGGASMTGRPLIEASYERLLAPIALTEPPHAGTPESFVESLTIAGTANVFEATIVYEVVDGDGKIITEGFTTATCGTGCRGDFSERVKFEVTKKTLATLNVYSPSAQDASRMFEVSVPVYLCPVNGIAENRIGDDPYTTCGGD